jgi:hypothetical protein
MARAGSRVKRGPRPSGEPVKVAVAAKVPPETAALLSKWAVEEGRTVSAIVRELLVGHVDARCRLIGQAA